MAKWSWLQADDSRQLGANRGLLLGDAFFTTMRCIEGSIQLWAYHWQRIQKSCQLLGIAQTEEREIVSQLERSGVATSEQSALRLTVWREQARRGYSVSDQAQIFAMTSFYPLPPAKKYWSLTISPIELARTSALEGIKHTNRLNQVLAAQHLRNFDECLMGTENFLYCGHKSNLFFRMKGCWYTPINREYGVEGVMQSHILHLFAEHNINIERKPLALDKLKDLEAVFMSNALVGAVPVSQLNELHLSVDAVADLFIDQLQSPHLLAGNWV